MLASRIGYRVHTGDPGLCHVVPPEEGLTLEYRDGLNESTDQYPIYPLPVYVCKRGGDREQGMEDKDYLV